MNKLYEGWIDNNIGDEGVESLGEVLKINTSLTQLDLAGDEEMRNEMKELKSLCRENEKKTT